MCECKLGHNYLAFQTALQYSIHHLASVDPTPTNTFVLVGGEKRENKVKQLPVKITSSEGNVDKGKDRVFKNN